MRTILITKPIKVFKSCLHGFQEKLKLHINCRGTLLQVSAKPQHDSNHSEFTVDFSLVVRLSLLDITWLLYSSLSFPYLYNHLESWVILMPQHQMNGYTNLLHFLISHAELSF